MGQILALNPHPLIPRLHTQDADFGFAGEEFDEPDW